ncbi:hypothetical protein At1D1108_02840 [Agrobacterium tumefaciens]|nr:hypothetical protein At1D1108_02840 [Agrobacterium tumefaciens]MDP9559602.1 hypothetical protein [Rhizobium nepotum]TWC89963.1 hypothetical protein FB593_1011240 [Rhizobium sp. SJZ105]
MMYFSFVALVGAAHPSVPGRAEEGISCSERTPC